MTCSPIERRIFRRLAVFAGGWSPEAAETVCGAAEGPAGATFAALASLVTKNLVQSAPRGDMPRFTMLETIREYAHERLAASGEEERIRCAHAAHFLALVDGANQALIGPGQVAVRARIERDYDNLRGALRWSVDRGAVGRAGWLGWKYSWRCWSDRVLYTEGRSWAGGDPGARRYRRPPVLFLAALRRGRPRHGPRGRRGGEAVPREGTRPGAAVRYLRTALRPRSRNADGSHRQGDYAAARAYLEETWPSGAARMTGGMSVSAACT